MGKKILSVFLLSVFLFSCSHVTLELNGKLKSEDKIKNITYRKSYENKNANLCYISAIFFGGACWFHLVYPTVNQEALFLDDMKKEFEKQYQIPFKLEDPVIVKKIGWSLKETYFELENTTSTNQ
ncbi:MAG: hypothetical protein A2381_04200 [Bdellovibrionales bacterium RIFOXYB1_FULL_37_110]|nr:MAG: hypothetical protein A2417_03465 [Bdellovibrionales bacterium RIFOXYC1_FULL_37_79]OFZ57393.1 MAG: hypothetical protein A2381_04200 [Bdellovibrionales bacterium RIFOXYB1_FULL_37_110]OFZ64954.1 MAG: hypothetical protein A2577_02685 [Bdellovibrionales bacterium RIFOXYD1_FULL_36_51]